MDKERIIGILSNIYNEMNNVSTEEDVLEALSAIKFTNLVSFYLNIHTEYDDEDKIIISLAIKILQNIYNNMNIISPITDEEYDKLYEIMLDSSKSNIVGSKISTDKVTAFHRYPDLRGTLDKVHFFTNEEKNKDKRKSIQDWYNSIVNKLGRPLGENEKDVTLFPKFDGVSVIFECDPDGKVEKALTRGDVSTNEAIDITRLFGTIRFIPYKEWSGVPFGIKTEIIMTQSSYVAMCKKFASFNNRRSAVSSILNSKELNTSFLKYLTIVPLRLQNFETKEIIIHPEAKLHFPYIDYTLNDISGMKPLLDSLKETVTTMMGVPVDGAVIYMNDKRIQTLLGREDNINKFEVAYKYPPESKKTILKDIEFCIGVLGTVTPVAKVEPIVINGNTISNISLGSMDRFESLNLGLNDEVIVKYDIIPYLFIDETCKTTGDKIPYPIDCPHCNEALIKDPVLKCVNTECPSRAIGKIVNYITKMGLSNISIGIVSTLFREGYLKSIEDLYRLQDHKNKITKLDGFGTRSFKNIVDGINSRKEVYDYELLGSLGIPDIGRRIFKKILSIYYLDDLIDICIKNDTKKLTTIHGIRDKTSTKIIAGILSNLQLIAFLKEKLKIKRGENKKHTIKVLFTKIRDKEFEEFLESKGVLVLDAYSNEVDILIVPSSDTTSTKIDKAKKNNKEIVTIAKAYEMFSYQSK